MAEAAGDATVFFVEVPTAGFQWVDAERAPTADRTQAELGEVAGRYLTAGCAYAATDVIRYDPRKAQPALFHLLAEIEPSEAGVLAFASRYGHLEAPPYLKLISLPEKLEAAGTPRPYRVMELGYGEPLEVWADHIFAMRRVLELWEAASAATNPAREPWDTAGSDRERVGRETLAARLTWCEARGPYGPRITYHGEDGTETAVPCAEILDLLGLPSGDLVFAARYLIQQELNARLDNRTRVRQVWGTPRGTHRLELAIVPAGLAGAIWLQLAEAVTRQSSFRRCDKCDARFVISGRSRRDQKYCSNSCRVRACQQRKKADAASPAAATSRVQ